MPSNGCIFGSRNAARSSFGEILSSIFQNPGRRRLPEFEFQLPWRELRPPQNRRCGGLFKIRGDGRNWPRQCLLIPAHAPQTETRQCANSRRFARTFRNRARLGASVEMRWYSCLTDCEPRSIFWPSHRSILRLCPPFRRRGAVPHFGGGRLSRGFSSISFAACRPW